MMREGLKKWRELSDDERKLASDSDIRPRHRWEDSYQPDGLDITVISRDLPEKCEPDAKCEIKWNRDRLWFSKPEARRWLPSKIKVGEKHRLPEPFLERIARLHLVDTVRGQTSYYSKEDISGTEISVEITNVDDKVVSIHIRGNTIAESPFSRRREMPHGIQTELLGTAKYDLQKEKFVEFDLVALGTRWGRTVFNGRDKDLDESPVGFVLKLTPKDQPVIAPAFIYAYGADWIKYPKR